MLPKTDSLGGVEVLKNMPDRTESIRLGKVPEKQEGKANKRTKLT